jgi:hypothetical protein
MQQNLVGCGWRVKPMTSTDEHLDSCHATRIVVAKTDVITLDNTVSMAPKRRVSPSKISVITVDRLGFSKKYLALFPSLTAPYSCSEISLRNPNRVPNESYTVFFL